MMSVLSQRQSPLEMVINMFPQPYINDVASENKERELKLENLEQQCTSVHMGEEGKRERSQASLYVAWLPTCKTFQSR
jgi:hypothetical protein